MVTRLRRVNPFQFALVSGMLYAFVGLIFALLWLPFVSLMGTMGTTGATHMLGAGLGLLALVAFPVFYFILMFVLGLITAALYNLIASWTGGFEVTLEQVAGAGAAVGGYPAT